MIARKRLKQVIAAASHARHSGNDIDVEDGKAIARTGNKPSLTFGELARMAQGMPGFSFAPGQTPGLEHTAYFTPPQASYCNGTHVVELEVDPMTGGVAILHYTVAHDSGNVINPMIVDGQVQGGVAHGIGNAMFEWMKYDDDANPLNHVPVIVRRHNSASPSSTSRRRTRSIPSASKARGKAAPFRRPQRSSPRSKTRCRRSACTSPTCR
jgi:CO/xanthine dehydrogenase Mo-binding subunit